ncbi:DsrE family protein [Fundidesulfovibrio soli]|uniref:DsrE family protein n=1 Tax=Fundidesulfovibrio soli TaxID=2922716 RepID=UPI001FAF5BCF|nr:DsrE family protein [Fundidesulfovibrio soli]
MSKFLFVLSRGPEDSTRAVRAMFLAKVAAGKGHDVTVFLLDEAVYWSNLGMAERVRIPTGDAMIDQIRELQDKGVKFLVCKPCAEARLIGADDLPAGFEISTAAVLIDMAVEAKVFSF